MKKPKPLKIKEKEDYAHSLSLSNLSDVGKCHVMTSSYGEITSISLNKTEVKRIINWLIKWLKFQNGQKGRKR